MGTIVIPIRMVSPVAVEILHQRQLTQIAVAIAQQRYNERRRSIGRHADVLTDEECQFSPTPFIFPRIVELSPDTFVRSREPVGDIKNALEHQVLRTARARFPETDDDFEVRWE
jgi:hypothetical protein